MKVYFVKYQLLARANLYAISRSTEAEIELQGLPVKNVIRYNLVTGETSKAEKDKNILLFGSMTPRKNILRTVMAWDLIQQEFPDYKLVLVGRYSNSAKFLILNVLKSGKDSICFTGEISDLEVDKLFQSAKLLVAPSTAEGLGLPLIKAIEFGTPIICARIDSYLEFVANKKSFFDPFSVSDISQNIWYAVASPDEYITDINLVKIGKVDFSNII
jgi:glycosyltransferase involved in cell wall biosynthesis